ncbi:MAG: hypothetical protein CYPHOPRED_001004 [Cyphobasidiales sp. Tagirdzhanova-0007]|nr:MAG: hypothetical protein CYPHOPRED_001004 [Cyphobasidiales sp. Tagirdzhanova-0007]
MSSAADAANRKTVACQELHDSFKVRESLLLEEAHIRQDACLTPVLSIVSAFLCHTLLNEQDSHPDGKAMAALADRLGLNKKQVSNFFERERRKAGIVIAAEYKRKGSSANASRKPFGTIESHLVRDSPNPAAFTAPATRKRTRKAAIIDKSEDEEDEDANSLFDDSKMIEEDDYLALDTQPSARAFSARTDKKILAPSPSPSTVSSRATSPMPQPAQQHLVPAVAPETRHSPSHLLMGNPRRKKRKANSASPSASNESPTVQFLKNPFPSPVYSPQELQQEQEPQSFQNVLDTQLARKRARVWFSRPGTLFPTVPLYNKGRPKTSLTSIVDKKQNATTKSIVPFNTAPKPFDCDEEEGHSDYDDDETAAMRKRERQRAGAALRTTIACTELKNAFLANPHPATGVLDALAVRLGLEKKQVSNYFVRERKKAGYQIKIRHGLNARRRGGLGLKNLKKPSLVVTQHAEHELSVGDDGEMDEQEESEGEEDAASYINLDDAFSQISEIDAAAVLRGANSTSNSAMAAAQELSKDDLPDLSYDDVASIRSENLSHTESISSLLMLATNSQDSASTRHKEDFYSPPYKLAPLLPPSQVERKNQAFHPGLPIIAGVTVDCDALRDAFAADPYPTSREIDKIAAANGKTRKQIDNYFVRQRNKNGIHRVSVAKKDAKTPTTHDGVEEPLKKQCKKSLLKSPQSDEVPESRDTTAFPSPTQPTCANAQLHISNPFGIPYVASLDTSPLAFRSDDGESVTFPTRAYEAYSHAPCLEPSILLTDEQIKAEFERFFIEVNLGIRRSDDISSSYLSCSENLQKWITDNLDNASSPIPMMCQPCQFSPKTSITSSVLRHARLNSSPATPTPSRSVPLTNRLSLTPLQSDLKFPTLPYSPPNASPEKSFYSTTSSLGSPISLERELHMLDRPSKPFHTWQYLSPCTSEQEADFEFADTASREDSVDSMYSYLTDDYTASPTAPYAAVCMR